MNAWGLLILAIMAEVVGTAALKSSDGFTRWLPSLIVVAGYGVAFYCLAQVLKTIPMGVAYAVWSGLGIVLIALVGWFVHGQRLDLASMVGMGLIISGVLVLNLMSGSSGH